MKKRILLIATSLCLLVSSAVSMASSASYPAQKILRVLQYNSYVVIEFNAEPNTQNCTRNSSGEQARVGFTTRSGDGRAMLANLLTAFANDATVVAGVSGCINYGSSTIPRVYRMELVRP